MSVNEITQLAVLVLAFQ